MCFIFPDKSHMKRKKFRLVLQMPSIIKKFPKTKIKKNVNIFFNLIFYFIV